MAAPERHPEPSRRCEPPATVTVTAPAGGRAVAPTNPADTSTTTATPTNDHLMIRRRCRRLARWGRSIGAVEDGPGGTGTGAAGTSSEGTTRGTGSFSASKVEPPTGPEAEAGFEAVPLSPSDVGREWTWVREISGPPGRHPSSATTRPRNTRHRSHHTPARLRVLVMTGLVEA